MLLQSNDSLDEGKREMMGEKDGDDTGGYEADVSSSDGYGDDPGEYDSDEDDSYDSDEDEDEDEDEGMCGCGGGVNCISCGPIGDRLDYV